MPRPRRLAEASLILAMLAFGCGKGLLLAPNQSPTLALTSGPIDTSSSHSVAWSVPIAWDARDPDGTIDHVVATFLIDPQGRIVKRWLGLEIGIEERRAEIAALAAPAAPAS